LELFEGTKAIEEDSAAAKAAKNVSDLVRFMLFCYTVLFLRVVIVYSVKSLILSQRKRKRRPGVERSVVRFRVE
jgi:hypothetical protein